jgi:hypothetical protein
MLPLRHWSELMSFKEANSSRRSGGAHAPLSSPTEARKGAAVAERAHPPAGGLQGVRPGAPCKLGANRPKLMSTWFVGPFNDGTLHWLSLISTTTTTQPHLHARHPLTLTHTHTRKRLSSSREHGRSVQPSPSPSPPRCPSPRLRYVGSRPPPPPLFCCWSLCAHLIAPARGLFRW